MNTYYLTRKKNQCNQYLNYFLDVQIIKPINVNMIQTIYHTDAVYSRKLYKLHFALALIYSLLGENPDGVEWINKLGLILFLGLGLK